MKEIKRQLSLPDDAPTWELRRELAARNPVQAARILIDSPSEESVWLFRALPTPVAERIFRALDPPEQSRFIGRIAELLGRIAGSQEPEQEIDPDSPHDELPGCVVRRLLEVLPAEEREVLARFAGYPEASIARDMSAGFIALRPEFTTEEALEQIRRYGAGSRPIARLHVVDPEWHPLGVIRIRDLLLAPPGCRIARLTVRSCPVLRTSDDREEVAARFRGEGSDSLPVTDSAGCLLGVVSPDEIREIEREEATEDFQKFGGSEELDLSYTRTPLLSLVRKRAGWLVVLFLSEMLTASAMGYFDDEIARAVVLALFVPLIISSGGNSGSQAASLIIRALALGELSLRNGWYVLRKELLSGLLLGAILGTIGFVRILLWQQCGFYDYGPYWAWVATSVAVSLIFIVLWGTIAGAMIPLLLKRIGLDPATASAPFVATLADVTGLIIYFSVAALFLSGKLL